MKRRHIWPFWGVMSNNTFDQPTWSKSSAVYGSREKRNIWNSHIFIQPESAHYSHPQTQISEVLLAP